MHIMKRIVGRLQPAFKKSFPRKLFFLHIPKCGGTSMVDAISGCYGYGVIDTSQVFLDASAVFKVAKSFDLHFQNVSEKILLYSMAQEKNRFITGHFFFSSIAHQQFSEKWDFITFLREPVSRWFSQYYFNLNTKSSHYNTNMDLNSYLSSEVGIGSGRTLLNCLEGSGRDWVDDPETGVERAISNLKKFDIVGSLEHLDSFKSRFKENYEVDLRIGQLRKSSMKNGNKREEISGEVLNKVKEICKYDSMIYEYAISKLI